MTGATDSRPGKRDHMTALLLPSCLASSAPGGSSPGSAPVLTVVTVCDLAVLSSSIVAALGNLRGVTEMLIDLKRSDAAMNSSSQSVTICSTGSGFAWSSSRKMGCFKPVSVRSSHWPGGGSVECSRGRGGLGRSPCQRISNISKCGSAAFCQDQKHIEPLEQFYLSKAPVGGPFIAKDARHAATLELGAVDRIRHGGHDRVLLSRIRGEHDLVMNRRSIADRSRPVTKMRSGVRCVNRCTGARWTGVCALRPLMATRVISHGSSPARKGGT
jgi:hypothetical protein